MVEDDGPARRPDSHRALYHRRRGRQQQLPGRAWKTELQALADAFHVRIHVSHFPPGTSKWNKIEHRLFCHITQNWRSRPLRTFETLVELIGRTRTAAGLRVKAQLDPATYATGVQVTRAQMKELSRHPHDFHGEWNYELRFRRS